MTMRKWSFHYFKPAAGRALYLLSADSNDSGPNEIELFQPIYLKLKHSLDNNLFNLSIDANTKTKTIVHINKLLPSCHEAIACSRSVEEPDHPIHALNDEIQRLFSDDGWRQVRREMSQARKRSQTKTITISAGVYRDLLAYQEQNGFASFDEAIDDLLPKPQLFIHEDE